MASKSQSGLFRLRKGPWKIAVLKWAFVACDMVGPWLIAFEVVRLARQIAVAVGQMSLAEQLATKSRSLLRDNQRIS